MRASIRAAVIGFVLAPGLALGQPAPGSQPAPTAPPASPEPAKPAQAPVQKYREPDGDLILSKVIGASVSNDQNQVIGTIADVLLDKQDKADRAVLSVGGFLGVGSRLVQVPFSQLKIEADRIVLPGATKVSLENLSAYQAQ
ncbi:MAG TPA: PRC-barrel domain-containing protein [Acetobacteraceae bacterium]|nr:PRC-barrel domain-containing protein [Acetobacteraceae bacterium]